MFCNIMLIYYTINSANASNFGDLFCRLLEFGDVPAGTAEGGSGACAGPTTIQQAHGVGVTARSLDRPGLALGLFFLLDLDLQVKLPWVLLDFDELATTPIDAVGI